MRLSTLRKVIFWLFIILYFLTAPVLALYSLGFVFDPVSKNFVKTGIISVVSEPKSSDILVDHHYRGKSPAAISGLRPGRYHVEVVRKDYQSWSRDLEVRQEEVTRIEHILLIPKELHQSKSTIFPVNAFLPSDDDKYLFLVHQARNKVTILAHDVKKKKSFPVVEFEEKDSKVNSVEISSSADEKRVLIGFQSGSRTEYVASTVSEDALPVFLSKFTQDPVSNARFHPNDSEKLFCLNGDRIDLIDLGSRSHKTGLISKVLSFEVIGDKIYGFDSGQDLFSADLEGKKIVNLFPNQGFKRFFFGDEDFEPYRVFMTEKGTMFWLSEDGKLLMNRLPYFIDEDVKSVRLMPGLEQLLFWKSKELWLLDLQTAGKRDSFFEEGPQKRLIWKSDRPILFAQMIRQGKYAVMATAKTIELIEMNFTTGNSVSSQTIAEHWAGDELSIHLDELSGRIYWTGCDSDERTQICEAELLEPSLFPFSIKFTKPYHSPVQISLD